MTKKYYREDDVEYYKQYINPTTIEAWCDFGLYKLFTKINEKKELIE